VKELVSSEPSGEGHTLALNIESLSVDGDDVVNFQLDTQYEHADPSHDSQIVGGILLLRL
jgi:hypothetical protein